MTIHQAQGVKSEAIVYARQAVNGKILPSLALPRSYSVKKCDGVTA